MRRITPDMPPEVAQQIVYEDISDDDAVSEGVEGNGCSWKNYALGRVISRGRGWRSCDASADRSFMNAGASFCTLWSTLHTKPGERWEDNPEVVRVGRFRVIGNCHDPAPAEKQESKSAKVPQ